MSSAPPLLRAAAALLGAGAVLAGLVGTAGPASADPPPNCTTADMTGVMSGVSAAMSIMKKRPPTRTAILSASVLL